MRKISKSKVMACNNLGQYDWTAIKSRKHLSVYVLECALNIFSFNSVLLRQVLLVEREISNSQTTIETNIYTPKKKRKRKHTFSQGKFQVIVT